MYFTIVIITELQAELLGIQGFYFVGKSDKCVMGATQITACGSIEEGVML